MAKFITITTGTMPLITEKLSVDSISSFKQELDDIVIVLKEVENGRNKTVKDLNCHLHAFEMKMKFAQ